MTDQSEPKPETVAFHFMRPKAGAQPDANGFVPNEEVTLEIPLTAIVKPTPLPPDLSVFPDEGLLKLYSLALKLPEQSEAETLLAEIKRRGLNPLV